MVALSHPRWPSDTADELSSPRESAPLLWQGQGALSSIQRIPVDVELVGIISKGVCQPVEFVVGRLD